MIRVVSTAPLISGAGVDPSARHRICLCAPSGHRSARARSRVLRQDTYAAADAGNRLTAPGTTAVYDGAGQLTACTGCGTVDHDSAGRTTALAGWTYEYDAEGRLTTATETATGDRLEMAYDAAGHRTQLREYTAGVLTRTRDLRYQGDAIVEESVAGTVVRSYSVTDAGQVVLMTIPAGQSSAGVYLPTWNGHGDALALWRMESDGTLTLANSYTYSTWGRPTTATHNGIPDLGFRFLYVGASDVQWDDFSGAGLQYMHARHYSPLTGRFLQPDPSAAEANLYAYAGDSPVTKVDPSGNCGPCVIAIVWVGGMAILIVGGSLVATTNAARSISPRSPFVRPGLQWPCLWGCGSSIHQVRTSPTLTPLGSSFCAASAVGCIRGDPTHRPWTPPSPRTIPQLLEEDPIPHAGTRSPGGPRFPLSCRSVGRKALCLAFIAAAGAGTYFFLISEASEGLEDRRRER